MGLPHARHTDHRIVLLKDSTPPRHCLYRIHLTQKGELKRQIDELLAAGHIERAESPFGAGVLLVEKHDKTLSLCVDYRRLNTITVKDVYPTPRVDDSIDMIKRAGFFVKMEWLCQIRVAKEGRCPQNCLPNGIGFVSMARYAFLTYERPHHIPQDHGHDFQ